MSGPPNLYQWESWLVHLISPQLMAMECMIFPHLYSKHSQVYLSLFRKVSNAADLKARIIAASIADGENGEKERERVNFAFIDARLVRHGLFLHLEGF